jgi:hypothetical protein
MDASQIMLETRQVQDEMYETSFFPVKDFYFFFLFFRTSLQREYLQLSKEETGLREALRRGNGLFLVLFQFRSPI